MRTLKLITLSSLIALSGFFLACAEESDPASSDATGGTQSSSGGVGGSGGVATGGGVSTGGGSGGGLPATGGLGGDTGTGGDIGTGGVVEVPQGVPFYPEGIEIEYVGEGPSLGLEVIAFTLVQKVGFSEEPAMYVAVKNSGPDPICLVDVPVSFLDATGVEIGWSSGAGALHAPMYESYGDPTPCLGTGDIGMGEITLNLNDLDVSKVAKIEHGFAGNVNPDAFKLNVVAIASSALEEDNGSYRVTGSMTNSGPAVDYPQVAAYAVDPVGRPYGIMWDIQDALPTTGWSFETSSYQGADEAVTDYEIFLEYDVF
jgi:hypothetical protein